MKEWPGQVFSAEGLGYEVQMIRYVAQRAVAQQRRRKRPAPRAGTAESIQLRAEEEELRLQRRRRRQARKKVDEAWRSYRQERRQQKLAWRARSRAEKDQQREGHEQQEEEWRTAKAARRQERETRRGEDAAWRQARNALRERRAQLKTASPLSTAWLAILVIVDNCTRRCLGLSLFTVGAHVTAEMVSEALRALLPASLQFLISDNGSPFSSEPFADLTRKANFIHVRIAPYRARTNGIAERFILTFKGWLEKHTWTNADECGNLLPDFQMFYNDRPHQGRELKGLSPNEYARRLVACATC